MGVWVKAFANNKEEIFHSFLIFLKNINFAFMILAKYLGSLILSMKSLYLLLSNNLFFFFFNS